MSSLVDEYTDIESFLSCLDAEHERYVEIACLAHLFFIIKPLVKLSTEDLNSIQSLHSEFSHFRDFLTTYSVTLAQHPTLSDQLTFFLGLAHLPNPLLDSSFKQMISHHWLDSFHQLVNECFPLPELSANSSPEPSDQSDNPVISIQSQLETINSLVATCSGQSSSIIQSLSSLILENIGALISAVSGESLSIDYVKSVKKRFKGIEESNDDLNSNYSVLKIAARRSLDLVSALENSKTQSDDVDSDDDSNESESDGSHEDEDSDDVESESLGQSDDVENESLGQSDDVENESLGQSDDVSENETLLTDIDDLMTNSLYEEDFESDATS
ncbi:hypothetical protein GEMRC1_011556 [Eukaryota sp. GEM-RC1]